MEIYVNLRRNSRIKTNDSTFKIEVSLRQKKITANRLPLDLTVKFRLLNTCVNLDSGNLSIKTYSKAALAVVSMLKLAYFRRNCFFISNTTSQLHDSDW